MLLSLLSPPELRGLERYQEDNFCDRTLVLSKEEIVLSYAMDKDLVLLRRLLTRGVNINMNGTHRRGDTYLEAAIHCNRLDVVRLLIEFGADVNKGRSALAGALSGFRNYCMFEVLLNAGACLTWECPYGGSAIGRACATEGLMIIQLLIQHGADIHGADAHGQTPLQHAVCNWGHTEVPLYLIKLGVECGPSQEGGRNIYQQAEFIGRSRLADEMRQAVKERQKAGSPPA